MPTPRLYIDTCCFIDLIQYKPQDQNNPQSEEIWFLRKIFEASKNGDIELMTSYLTIAEFRRGQKNQVTDETKRLIESVLMSGTFVKLAQVTKSIAILARDLDWENGIQLSGADAIHISTALKMECQEFLTSDKRILRHSDQLKHKNIIPVTPSNTTLLPHNYRQENYLDNHL